MRRTRLSNGSPTCVFHQGPQACNLHEMTVCSLASPRLVDIPHRKPVADTDRLPQDDSGSQRYQGHALLDRRGKPL